MFAGAMGLRRGPGERLTLAFQEETSGLPGFERWPLTVSG